MTHFAPQSTLGIAETPPVTHSCYGPASRWLRLSLRICYNKFLLRKQPNYCLFYGVPQRKIASDFDHQKIQKRNPNYNKKYATGKTIHCIFFPFSSASIFGNDHITKNKKKSYSKNFNAINIRFIACTIHPKQISFLPTVST